MSDSVPLTEPCGHPCKCHAINPDHDCEQTRKSITLEWYEKDAIERVRRECGLSAMFEVVNRLLTSTAEHQHTSGFDSGQLLAPNHLRIPAPTGPEVGDRG